MTKTKKLTMFAAVCAFGIGASVTTRAAVGPISMVGVQDEAQIIAIGHITRVLERDEKKGDYLLGHITVTMNLMKVEKGSLPPESQELEFTGIKMLGWPAGMVGASSTIRDDLAVGDRVRVYLRRDGDHWQVWHPFCVVKSPKFGR